VGTSSEDELDRAREESIARLESGRLPLEAEKRLQELRGRANFFTSDLTVSEFALGREFGLRPVSQVMGSCVYHAAIRANMAWTGWTPGQLSTEPVIARPWNDARRIALERMTMEAAECGADAVIGVHVKTDAREFAIGSVEFQALGTAIRVDGVEPVPARRPVLCALSGQEYWRLLKAGCQIAGLVAATEVVSAIPDIDTQRGQAWGRLSSAGYSNREIREFSEATARAVKGAVWELHRQAQNVRASGIVGVTIEHDHLMIERENPDYNTGYGSYGSRYSRAPGSPSKREDLIVTAHALGTAIIESDRTPREAGLRIEPVRRLDNNRRNS
jgi:uncharacterized protein YbjQ (UPF0145 family)